MMKTFVFGTVITITSALALPAYACGFHGGAYGNVNWQTYNPRVSIEDPALLDQNTDQASLITPLPAEKARPVFSNVANRAALIAKARVAKKAKDRKDKAPKNKVIKKASLNANR